MRYTGLQCQSPHGLTTYFLKEKSTLGATTKMKLLWFRWHRNAGEGFALLSHLIIFHALPGLLGADLSFFYSYFYFFSAFSALNVPSSGWNLSLNAERFTSFLILLFPSFLFILFLALRGFLLILWLVHLFSSSLTSCPWTSLWGNV